MSCGRDFCNLQFLQLFYQPPDDRTVKLLGVTLDQHLTFRTQIDNVVSKCHGLLGTLARATPYLPKQLLNLAYTALIRSHLEYCSSLYSAVAKTHLKKLDVIQKKTARIIYQVPADTHVEPILILLDLDTLRNRREEHFIRLIKSFISGKCHPAMKSFVSLQPDNSLVIQSSRTSLGRRRPGSRCKSKTGLVSQPITDADDETGRDRSCIATRPWCGWRYSVQPPTWLQFWHRGHIVPYLSQVQGAVNGPDIQYRYLNYQYHAQQSSAFIYVSTARCYSQLSSSDCTERRLQQQQQLPSRRPSPASMVGTLKLQDGH